MHLISSLNSERGITVVMVTHDAKCAEYARRQLVFRDGKILSDTVRA
jgi:putative ABC transport system ATP-binding protein